MKKNKLWKPLITLAAVAPIAGSLVSCGENNIEGNEIKTSLYEEMDYFYFYSDVTIIKKDSIYTIVANLSKLKYTTEMELLAVLCLSPGTNELILDNYIDVQKVIVNGQSLIKLASSEDVEEYATWVVVDSFIILYPKKGETFKAKENVYITFKAKVDFSAPCYWFLSDDS